MTNSPDESAEGRRGLNELSADITQQSATVVGDRTASYKRALEHIAALIEGPAADAALVAKLARCWRDRTFYAYYERPLLLLAAIRNEVLFEGPAHPLGAGFASVAPDPSAVTREHRLNAGLVPARLEALSRTMPPGGLLLAYQTLVRGYLDPERDATYARNMKAWLAARAPGTAAWLELEMHDGRPSSTPAELTAHTRNAGGEIATLRLARCGYHPFGARGRSQRRRRARAAPQGSAMTRQRGASFGGRAPCRTAPRTGM